MNIFLIIFLVSFNLYITKTILSKNTIKANWVSTIAVILTMFFPNTDNYIIMKFTIISVMLLCFAIHYSTRNITIGIIYLCLFIDTALSPFYNQNILVKQIIELTLMNTSLLSFVLFIVKNIYIRHVAKIVFFNVFLIFISSVVYEIDNNRFLYAILMPCAMSTLLISIILYFLIEDYDTYNTKKWRSMTKNKVLKNMKYGDNINKKDLCGNTPLMKACLFSENMEVIYTLIQLGANVNQKDEHGNTPLILTASNEKINFEIIKMLVEAGADVNVRDDMEESFFSKLLLADNIKYEDIKYIIEKGVKIDNYDIINACAYNRNTEIITLLINNGANVNADDFYRVTPLMYVCMNSADEVPLGYFDNTLDIVKILINNGADISLVDKEGKSALTYALDNPELKKSNDFQEIIELLTFGYKAELISDKE